MRRIIFALTLLTAAPALAENITVKVDGMVCAYCAAGIEQLFSEEAGVEKVHVDLEKGEVHLTTAKEGTLSDPRIGALIEKSGYTAGDISRTE